MLRKAPSHNLAVGLAFLVTFLWSTSWVLIKFGLENVPALTFAGLRYVLATFCLLPFALHGEGGAAIGRLSRNEWGNLILLGVVLIAVTQGAQYVSLSLLPAITTSLVLNFTAPITALLGLWLLREHPGVQQWAGLTLFMGGIGLYFYPVALPSDVWLGLAVAGLAVIGNSVGTVMMRAINRTGSIPPQVTTAVSMGVGGFLMLAAGLIFEPAPLLGWKEWGIIAWLALVNTAFTFTLWNHTLRTLSAMESSIINNTMTIQIAILAWIFLGERLNAQTGAGLALAALGAALVQLHRRKAAEAVAPGGVQPSLRPKS